MILQLYVCVLYICISDNLCMSLHVLSYLVLLCARLHCCVHCFVCLSSDCACEQRELSLP